MRRMITGKQAEQIKTNKEAIEQTNQTIDNECQKKLKESDISLQYDELTNYLHLALPTNCFIFSFSIENDDEGTAIIGVYDLVNDAFISQSDIDVTINGTGNVITIESNKEPKDDLSGYTYISNIRYIYSYIPQE